MTATVRLWWLLRRRSAEHGDAHRLTELLAVLAFAVTTAIVLVVLGGYGAFAERAVGSTGDAATYPFLAGTAVALLMVPLMTLGGAAARLAVARRDARLAAIRLVGGSTSQVSLLTALDALTQALVGGLLGIAGYFGLIPLVQLIVFQDRPFVYAELVVAWPVIPLTALGVLLVALISAGVSLRSVVITPLGVAQRVGGAGLHWSRVIPALLAVAAFVVLLSLGRLELIMAVVLVVMGLGLLNLIGPFVMSVIGRIWARRARKVTTLLAARRVSDAPKTAWRSVGGVGLATFIAGLIAAMATATAGAPTSAEDAVFVADLATGGFLTLAIAGLLAGVSTGVMQAGRVIDQRSTYRALSMAGTDLRVMDRARLGETAIPLIAVIVISGGFSALFLLPALGLSALAQPMVVVQFLLSVAGACLLVMAGAFASRGVVRTVLAEAG